MAEKKTKTKAGYFVKKGKCQKVYKVKKMNKKTGKTQTKKVDYKGKALKKGTKVFKTKALCMKYLKKMQKKSKKTVTRSTKSRKVSKFGEMTYAYEVPYFGQSVPRVANSGHGTDKSGLSSSAWMWPQPGAYLLDKQQGRFVKRNFGTLR
jgi:hypothetical protein